MSSDEEYDAKDEEEKSSKEEYFDILDGLDDFDPGKLSNQESINSMTKTVLEKSPALIKQFLEQEKTRDSVNKHDLFGRTPLHWAVGARQYPGYKTLLDNGAMVDIKTIPRGLSPVVNDKRGGFTALMIACIKGGNPRSLLHLLTKGADFSQKANSSATAFHIAAASGSRDCLKLIYLAGCNPGAILDDNRTAVDLAIDEKTKLTVFRCLRCYSSGNEKRCQVCASCGNSTNYLNRCGKCYITFYCNRRCQLSHWRESHHLRCVGSIRGIVINKVENSRQFYHKKKRKQRPFIVELAVPPTNVDVDVDEKVTFTSDNNCVKGIVQNDFPQYDELVSFVKAQGKGPKHTVSFWSQFLDTNFDEVKIYHGAHVPPLIRHL